MATSRRTSILFVTATLATVSAAAAQVSVEPPASLTFTLVPAHMTKPRTGHTATLLNTGDVLIAGGWDGSADEASAEVYNPGAGTFTATVGPMTEARRGHTATLLSASTSATYAKVLIVGSADKADVTAELYSPATGLFARTGSMTHARQGATATLLNNGKVLIVGGNTTTGDKTAELYNPATGTFSVTGSTRVLRTGHTATLLSDGSVLIAGGSGTSLDYGEWATAAAERYYPASGTFTATGSMTVARTGHTATRLGAKDGTKNGEVLIVGIEGSADLYNPGTGKFTPVGGSWDASAHSASLRDDGTVLVAGGSHQVQTYFRVARGFNYICVAGPTLPYSTNVAGLFTYTADGFVQTGALSDARDGHTATVLADGSVLIAGGTHHITRWPSPYYCPTTPPGSATVLSSAELFK